MRHHPRPARRRLLRLLVTAALIALLPGCQLLFRPQLEVTPVVLEFPAQTATRAFEVANAGAEGSLLRWSASGSSRLTIWPSSGTLRAGETQQVWVNVNRSDLAETTLLTARVEGGNREVQVTAIVDPPGSASPASCSPDPEVRYAGLQPWPLEAAAAAFAAAGVEPTGVLVRWSGPAEARPLAVPPQMSAASAALATRLVPLAGGAWLASADALALARSLAAEPSVRWVELDGPVVRPSSRALALPDDPFYAAGDQWYLDAFGFAEGRLAPSAVLADDVVVAVIDTGLRTTHEEHVGRFVPGRSFVNGAVSNSTVDGNGHGTHVAGLIGAAEGNGVGIVGLASHASVRVQPIKVFGGTETATIADLVTALRWAAGLPVDDGSNGTLVNEARVDVINMSLGSTLPSEFLRMAAIDARCAGVVLVAAAGNGGASNGVDYPAAYPEVVSVGSVDQNQVRSTFSDYGEGRVDLMAPGGRPLTPSGACGGQLGLLSTYVLANDGYICQQGTSMATPLVAASAAVLVASDPGAYRGDPAAVETALRAAAARNPGPNRAEYGHGVLCLDALLSEASVCGVAAAP